MRHRVYRRRISEKRQRELDRIGKYEFSASVLELGVAEALKHIYSAYELDIVIETLLKAKQNREQIDSIIQRQKRRGARKNPSRKEKK